MSLDRLDPDRSRVPDADRLALVAEARVLAGRLDAVVCVLVAEADAAGAALRATGTPSTSWLAVSANLSKKESAAVVLRARALAGHQRVQQAAVEGRLGMGQARAITGVLDGLPAALTPEQRDQAEQRLLDHAAQFDAAHLAGMSEQVLREVSPATADDHEAERQQRLAEAAHRNRGLSFFRDPEGSVSFRGSLPAVDAEGWIAIIDSYVESCRRCLAEERDPLAEPLTPQQRRADALTSMIADHTTSSTRSLRRRRPPPGGGDPLLRRPAPARRRNRDAASRTNRLAAGDLRRLCCEADLIPAVLGGASEILDVGRAHRLVTRAIRTALTQRDAGCVFPGCDTHPTACEAHHILPWWAGGHTSLANLALLCHHHHALIEPATHSTRDQWAIQIAPDGTPETIPPRRLDPDQRPLRHQRFHQRALTALTRGSPPDHPPDLLAAGGDPDRDDLACAPGGAACAPA